MTSTSARRPWQAAGPQFEYGTCHHHYHFLGYADYRLYDDCGHEAGHGHKQSFCLEDSRYTGNNMAPRAATAYNCDNQGIHHGYSDVYTRGLDCQFVDITDVAPGTYYLRARINLERSVSESNYDDNVGVVEVNVPPPEDGASAPQNPVDACATAETGVGRDCGWEVENTHTCTPGAMVTVGCDATCMPAMGSCTGDTMIRVCPDSAPCTGEHVIVDNDDSGCGASGNTCSRTAPFACPASGHYTVLIGAYTAGTPSQCVVATSP